MPSDLTLPIDEKEVDKELARRSLLSFTQYTKSDFETVWFHRYLSAKLDAFVAGEIRFLLIFMPPRVGKSEMVSRRLPPYIHGRMPNAFILAGSYSAGLAGEMTDDVQAVMDSPEYQELFPQSRITPKGKKGGKRTQGGHNLVGQSGRYRGAGVGGSFTGKGAQFAIIDDPFKNQAQADSITYRNAVWNWYRSSFRTRLEKNGQILITMTRWQEDDLAGRILALMKSDPDADQFEVVSFPMVRDTLEDPNDPRKLGEVLWPEKYNESDCRSLKAAVGSRVWQALYQQTPTAPEGGLVKRSWIRFYKALPDHFDEVLFSWDLSMKDTKTADYTVGQAWGRLGSQKYFLDQVRGRMDFPAEISAFRTLSAKWPKIFTKLVEDKANGPALISSLQKEISGIIAVNPKTSKQQRLAAVSPEFEAGNVLYPDPSIASWVHDNIEELVQFPNAAHDDTVDATTQALLRFRGEAIGEFTEEMQKTQPTMAESLTSGDTW